MECGENQAGGGRNNNPEVFGERVWSELSSPWPALVLGGGAEAARGVAEPSS